MTLIGVFAAFAVFYLVSPLFDSALLGFLVAGSFLFAYEVVITAGRRRGGAR